MPKQVKGTVYGLVALGFFFLLVGLWITLSQQEQEPFIPGCVWALMGIVSGIVLRLRVPGAKGIGIIFAMPMFLAFPLGTFIAWKIVTDLGSDEVAAYLAK